MKKLIPTVNELLQLPSIRDHITTLSVLNVDCFFRELFRLGIKHIAVSKGYMFMIAIYFVANIKRSGNDEAEAWKVLSEGKIDKFMGVHLHLID